MGCGGGLTRVLHRLGGGGRFVGIGEYAGSAVPTSRKNRRDMGPANMGRKSTKQYGGNIVDEMWKKDGNIR